MRVFYTKFGVEKMDIREDFCGLCAAVPVALAGFGASAVDTGDDRKRRNTIILIICAISVIGAIILLMKNWDCNQCKAT